jgi:hypothetical protein
MIHKVEALETYAKLGVADRDMKSVLPKGFQFEVDDERLAVLLGDNPYKVAFVKEVDGKEEEKKPKRKSKKKE